MTALRYGCHEETLVEGLTYAPATPVGINADEVAVDLARISLRLEPGEESDDRFVVDRDKGPRAKVGEEETRQHPRHLTAAPPGVDPADDPVVVF
jgi:hypothetical protein